MRTVLRRAAVPAAAVVALLAVAPAQAKTSQSVRCVGTADFCSATVNIGGGAKNRVVTIELTDTDLKPSSLRAVGGVKPNGFKVTKAGFRLGGSEYRFTLNALKANPTKARLIIGFARGSENGKLVTGGWVNATLQIENVPNSVVSIVGGGSGTSNCTENETVTTYTTTSAKDQHSFGFTARADGSCFWQESWSKFDVTIKTPQGQVIKSGRIWIEHTDALGDYYTNCSRFGNNWTPSWICMDPPRDRIDRRLLILKPR